MYLIEKENFYVLIRIDKKNIYILSKGAPKHAENPIRGKFCLAMLTSAAKSGYIVKALLRV
jgi:hypothetical protein